MKMLMFDFRDSEREYFNTHDLPDFDIEFIKEPLNENTELSEKQLSETDVISVFITSDLTENVIKKFKNLRIIATRSTGYNHIDLKYCTQNNIAVFNVGEYGSRSVAQFTFMLMLALVRKLIPAYLNFRENKTIEMFEGKNLENLTLGIMGGGSIGSSVAKIANSFGMDILICSYKKNPELLSFVKYTSKDEILKNSDIISLHLPYTTETYHILDNEAFNIIKDGVLVINTSRGELIDTIALYNNIISGRIGGAALDVIECDKALSSECQFKQEWQNNGCITKALALHKLSSMSNVIITPHIAYNTKESVATLLDTTFNNIRDYTKGIRSNCLK